MSDFLILNFDCPTSPSISLEETEDGKTAGWGFGWYHNESQAANTIRGAGTMSAQSLSDTLHKNVDFRSTVFAFKLRGIQRTYTYEDTQPISRSFAGRDWLFVHNGELDRHKLTKMDDLHAPFLKPVTSSDSESALCHLLNLVWQSKAASIADIKPSQWIEWFQQLDQLGYGNYVLTDSLSIVVYRGKDVEQPLYYNTFKPPHASLDWRSDQLCLELDGTVDRFRSMLIVTSHGMVPGSFHAIQPGQMLLARRSQIIWNSQQSTKAPEAITFGPSKPVSRQRIQFVQGGPINLRSITHDADGSPLSYRQYEVTHRTSYCYEKPVEHSQHFFRIHPVEDEIQDLLHASLTVSVEGELFQYEDVFSNKTVHYEIHKPYRELVITAKSQVRLFAMPIDDYSSHLRRASIPLVWMPWQRQMMLPYLLPPELPETQLRELTSYAMSFVERNDYNLMQILIDMNRAIFEDYTYVPGVTTVLTTAFDVYASRCGVCQDFANLFICLCRLLSIPSRYRMGYIHTANHGHNSAQSDASHAWVEVYLPYLGWRGFDPTNGTQVAQDHIRVACGRNYRDATPTTGTIFKGGGTEDLLAEVKVIETGSH